MNAVVLEQMYQVIIRRKVIDCNDLDIVGAAFDKGAQDAAADAAKPVDGNLDAHVILQTCNSALW